MIHMDHFKLSATPFEKDIPSEHLFVSPQFSEALARLQYCCERRTLCVITGEVGAGKSTLFRLLESKLDTNSYLFLYLADSQLTPRGFYATVLTELGVHPPVQLPKLKHTFKSVVQELYESKQKTCVVAIDEAQSLEQSMIQELRFIMNFGVDSYSPMALILAGETQFRHSIRTPHMAPIWRRIETSYHLCGMREEETKEYINHQIKMAGHHHSLFPDDVISKIHERAKGITAIVNILSKGCLHDAASRGQSLISMENLSRVLTEWNH